MSQVIGFVHNHDQATYGTTNAEERANRYPSDNDWNFADWMVSHGAGGADGAAGFALYVIDTKGNLREFEYADHSTYESLSDAAKINGSQLPPIMQDDGSSCGN